MKKNSNLINDNSQDQIKNLIIVVLIISIIFVAFYFVTKYILINSDVKIKIPENILIKIITFGFNSKSTIMISSVKENYIIISVQREIEKLNGDIIENQEKKIEIELNKKSSIYNEIINFLIKEL